MSDHLHFIRQWRDVRGLTQEDLAARVGMSVSSVSQLESGKQGFSASSLRRLAEAFDIEVWQLFVDPAQAQSHITPSQRRLLEAVVDLDEEAQEQLLGPLEAIAAALRNTRQK